MTDPDSLRTTEVLVDPAEEAEPTRAPGRPRDPMLEERALQAALEVFGEKGWAGLTIDEVATRSRVGKSSIYLRWGDKESLLTAALRRNQQRGAELREEEGSPPLTDEGSLRDFLIAHATRRAELYLSPNGLPMLRLYVEARAFPQLFANIRQRTMTEFVLEERSRVEEAIRRGVLPAHASAVHLLDAVEGAVLMHVLVTPPHLLDRVRSTLGAYVEQLVDNQLRAAAS
ncbi:TetR/AcrR family transcriptional regulator [Pengzhenrongella sicca]|uniref:TetR/AcrR family transcriptional regulator n=1 Tax=Pengzhenrongella sicca TaxID=2819238 RepID=A0A8A4ZDR2_9MICO|nr:TetR/AcrR family transcriptional regulator [Pengzhenrongella sicca]QTE30102.1 TetR/AcrR family transcriptional regulator [Pengzhenrongella sicca]